MEDQSPEWETFALSCSVAVALGVAAEIVGMVWTYRDEREEWAHGIVRPPSRPSRIKFGFELFATIVVVLGVFGEAVASMELASLNEKLRINGSNLRAASDQLLALTTLEAGTAEHSANDAASKAVSAEKASAGAETEAEVAKSSSQRATDISKKSITSSADSLSAVRTANAQLNTLEEKRAQLETSLTNMAVCSAPRVIPDWFTTSQSYVDPIKALAGRNFFIEFVPDAETRRAAMSIATALRKAGAIINPLRAVDGLQDGVSVQASESSGASDIGVHEAAGTLVDFLHSYNWQAEQGFLTNAAHLVSRDGSIIPLGSIRIQVGLYPAVQYVGSPGTKHFEDSIRVANEKGLDFDRQLEVFRQAARERALKYRSPQEVAEWDALDKKWREDRKRSISRYKNPCRTIFEVNTP